MARSDDDPDWIEMPEPGAGQVTTAGQSDDEPPAAIIYVPDPTERRGWGLWYVKRPKPQKARRVGFRR